MSHISLLLVYCELVHSVGKLPFNEHVCVVRIEVCVRNDNLVMMITFFLFLHFLYCELVHSQEVSRL